MDNQIIIVRAGEDPGPLIPNATGALSADPGEPVGPQPEPGDVIIAQTP